MKRVTSAVIAVLLLGAFAGPASASAPDDTSSGPATTVPADTTVPSDTTAPPSSVESTSGLVGVDEVGSTDATTVTWIAILVALALIGVAVWWMLRRTNDDDFPPAHPGDDWPSDSDVI